MALAGISAVTTAFVPMFDPKAVLDAFERWRVTMTVMVPTMIAMVLDHAEFRAERMESLRQRYGSEDYRLATGVMRTVHVRAVNETNESYEEQLRRIACPVELVWGDDDTAAPLATVNR